jgi:hypothetical protein
MGYSTYYKLEIHDDQGRYLDINEVKEALIDRVDYNPFEDSCKWYNHEEDVKWLSKKYGGTVFLLSGEGDDNEDMWRKYFLDGKMQVCKAVITYDNYSESKLKP